MSSKHFIKIWILMFLAISALVVGFNYVIDPFQQYRIQTFYPIYFNNAGYRNPGLSKNYKHDSVIIGTSMSENFLVNEVEGSLGFNKVLKLTKSGATAREEFLILHNDIKNNRGLKNVLFEICFSSYNSPHVLEGFPTYLYDDNELNDWQYLYSLDMVIFSLKSYLYQYVKSKNDPLFSFNSMYQWGHKQKNYGLENLSKLWHARSRKSDNKVNLQNLKRNFDNNLLSIVVNNRDIDFKFFFPPYSILQYKNLEEQGVLGDYLKFKKYTIKSLVEFKNVKIYDFQINENLTYDLSIYSDFIHFHQRINTYMLEQIKNNQFLTSKDDIESNIEDFYKKVKSYRVDFILE